VCGDGDYVCGFFYHRMKTVPVLGSRQDHFKIVRGSQNNLTISNFNVYYRIIAAVLEIIIIIGILTTHVYLITDNCFIMNSNKNK